MKTFIKIITFILLSNSFLFAQEREHTLVDTTKVKFEDWKDVTKITMQDRSFQTEIPTTVAGVRGAPKGVINFPSVKEIMKVIKDFKTQVKFFDEILAERKYFIAKCYSALGEEDKAKSFYLNILKNHKNTRFYELARKNVSEIEE